MNPTTDPLSQLRDIHLPPPIGWWPLASGWYVLAMLSIVTLFLVIRVIRHHHQQGQHRRQALYLLSTYVAQYEQDKQGQSAAARVSELLKRVALVYFPRAEVAPLQGEAWISFLQKQAPDLDVLAVRTLLVDGPYQAELRDDVSPLFHVAQLWIKQRRGRCLN